MMWRVAVASMTLASLAEPACAQWYPGWDRYGDRPYYSERPYYRDYRDQGFSGQPRRDPYDDSYDRNAPDRDRHWMDERTDDGRSYDRRQPPRQGGYGN